MIDSFAFLELNYVSENNMLLIEGQSSFFLKFDISFCQVKKNGTMGVLGALYELYVYTSLY